MSKRFHIIITGESGRSTAIQLSKRKLFISVSAAVAALLSICVISYFTTGSYFNSKRLGEKVEKLNARIEQTEKSNCDYADQVAALQKRHGEAIAHLKLKHEDLISSQHQEYEGQISSQHQEYEGQISSQHQEYKNLISSQQLEYETLLSSQQVEYETLLADQKVKSDLEATSLQLENVRLVSTAVRDLKKRSELIESVMATIGVKIKKTPATQNQENSGGPFVPDNEVSFDTLLQQVDGYLKSIRKLPLGKPINGRISSRYGKRTDPVNKKKAIHEGVDIKGTRGDKILATASGKVIKAMKNGGYGNYVEIDHGNGYITAFGHMQNYLVKKGETVKQGQVIGQVGSTGRSTGPHLHYEIRLNDTHIDPGKFMKVADISHTLKTNEKQK